MFYKCSCETVVHLSRDKKETDEIANLMCLDCFKKYKPNTYLVEYDIFPLRAIYRTKALASSEESAIEVVRKYKDDVTIQIRQVELVESY